MTDRYENILNKSFFSNECFYVMFEHKSRFGDTACVNSKLNMFLLYVLKIFFTKYLTENFFNGGKCTIK